MIKVLHINSNYLTSKLHENLLDCLESEKMHNTVFMPIKKEKKEEFLYESKHEVYHPKTFTNIDKFFFVWKQAKIFNKLKKTIDPSCHNIVHAHTLFTDGNVAYRLYKQYGIPYIVTVRGHTDIHGFFKKRINLRHRGRQILKYATKVIFLSESNRTELLEEYIKSDQSAENILSKSLINPNGIDDFWFENEGSPKQITDETSLKCIYVGKIMKNKNILNTIKALNILKDHYGIEASLTTVGKIIEPAYLKEIEREAYGKLSMLPQTSQEDLIHLYRKNNLFIMPSFTETFGLVYPEAMSQGLPVIYTKGQGFDGQFKEGEVGYAVNAKDPEDIAEKIMKIIGQYGKISKQAIEGYRKFHWRNLSQIYIRIYNEVYSKNEINEFRRKKQ